jgi:hypothetical protein
MIEIIKSDSELECKIGDLRNGGVVAKIESINFCWGRQFTFYRNNKPVDFVYDFAVSCGFKKDSLAKTERSFLDTMKRKYGKQWYGYAITIN